MTRNDEQSSAPQTDSPSGSGDTSAKASPSASTEIARWADVAMYTSKPIQAAQGPQVTLLAAPSDPLGLIAAQAATYEGKFYDDLAEIPDEERQRYLADMQLTTLAMPLESVMLNFSISGVTRGFTHQMVRQRTAAYAQESTRFSVIEDGFVDRVAIPPSLAGGHPISYWDAEATADVRKSGKRFIMDRDEDVEINHVRDSLVEMYGSPTDKARYEWEKALMATEHAYKNLVSSGVPAEDARGLLPTNITTRIKYNTNLRALLEHIGLRTCTQAQFEWRAVAAAMAQAIRAYGQTTAYQIKTGTEIGLGVSIPATRHTSSAWQFNAIADLFSPICYRKGKCVMKASFDRKCSIRDRVDTFANYNVPSSQWDQPLVKPKGDHGEDLTVALPIFPAEWLLNPGAAR